MTHVVCRWGSRDSFIVTAAGTTHAPSRSWRSTPTRQQLRLTRPRRTTCVGATRSPASSRSLALQPPSHAATELGLHACSARTRQCRQYESGRCFLRGAPPSQGRSLAMRSQSDCHRGSSIPKAPACRFSRPVYLVHQKQVLLHLVAGRCLLSFATQCQITLSCWRVFSPP